MLRAKKGRSERFTGTLNNLLFHNRRPLSDVANIVQHCCQMLWQTKHIEILNIVQSIAAQCSSTAAAIGWVYSCGKLSITDGISEQQTKPPVRDFT